MIGQRTITVLTGGADVPGPNPAIRATTIRVVRDGHRDVGIRVGRVAESGGAR